ncbi:non-ribosomal peptide synthetase [Pseudobacteroides cellulosolvens]|uniref:Amino acid adenylation domain protein n=1 Tax=Pseudobacteroides cellulosolvens ATCC 35603 = DSM 2933 TaxID=398512 RepID=A0A0L6JM09_9FIRM|nr:non-ribosomal peptide synthetase [Pseudobacteroides cellulosolvens]KNY26442.1 amino acid adenylation domain protein [Pseudobacteroides cellulosolvens ATCC 35603 = DSM 2933]
MNRNSSEIYPLTHPQNRIWYIENIYPETSMHNIGGTIRIKGSVDFKLLEESIQLFIKNTEGLRLKIIEQDGKAFQYVGEYRKNKLELFDFSICPNPEKEFEQWVFDEARKAFCLVDNDLFYFALFRVSDNFNGYMVKFHHIIADGWSVNVMTEQICQNYHMLSRNEKTCYEPGNSYLTYIEKELNYLTSDRFVKNKNFWLAKFRVLPDFLMKNSEDTQGRRKTYYFDENKSRQLKAYVEKLKCSLNVFFISAVLIYLNKITQQEDLVVGTPVLNRSGKKEKSMFGMFTSTMPFRTTINEQHTISRLINEINNELMCFYFNQKYPYDLLVQDLELKKKGYDSLFQIYVNYYNTRLSSNIDGVPIENVEFYNGNQFYSLQLVIKDWSDDKELTLDFDYKLSDFSEEQIHYMYSKLNNIVEQMLENPEAKVKDLQLLTEAEKQNLIYEFNETHADYPKEKTIFELFEEQVERTPQKIAVVFGNRELTYAELNRRSNQIAYILKDKGISRNLIVGIMTRHSVETLIGILGILKSGGAYLPIDPEYPVERQNFIFEDSGISILLSNVGLKEGTEYHGLRIDLEDEKLYKGEGTNPKVISQPEDLAYVIYTSGSTGKPKGVMVEHRGLVNYIWWAKKMYVHNQDDVFALYSSLSFDLTVTSVFTPLVSGNCVIVYDDDQSEFILYRILRENRVSIIKLTPSHLSLLKGLDNFNSSVRRFIVGGEDLKTSLCAAIHKSFGGNIEIYNEYGPTETVVGCMIHRYDFAQDTWSSVPIGVPADNVQIYILDKNLQPVPLGVDGEIYISGDGVARGYLKRPDLTHEKFILNPFTQKGRMYKTGDLGRHTASGKILYTGRTDYQVKIRGHRIETGEIESCLTEHDLVKDAVVIDRDDEKGNKYLCAYMVCDREAVVSEIREYLSKRLPNYMVPAYFVIMDKLPITPNGKINRNDFPKPLQDQHKGVVYTIYKSDAEKQLVETICEVLGVKGIGPEDNFYHLGGDSIKAIQIASKLKECGISIKVKDILSYPVIGELTANVEMKSREVLEDQKLCEGDIGKTPITEWFFSLELTNRNYWNQSVLLSLKLDIQPAILSAALNTLIDHHPSLRINYDAEKGVLFYNNSHLASMNQVQVYNLSQYSYSQQDRSLRDLSIQLKGSMDIENGPLLKACIFDLGERGKRLLLTAHHLVVDGVSWRILLEDFAVLIESSEKGIKPVLSRKAHSLQKWAHVLEKYSRDNVLKEKQFWEGVIKSNFSLSLDFVPEDGFTGKLGILKRQLTKEETMKLQQKANTAYNTKPVDLLIISLAIAISRMSERDEIVVELESHGREELYSDIDVSGTVGWFTSMYPIALRVEHQVLGRQIKSLKEQLKRIPHHGIGFGIMKYLAGILDDQGNKYIRFNYLGEFDIRNDYFEIGVEDSGPDYCESNPMTCLIDMAAVIMDKSLHITITYDKSRFREATIECLADDYWNTLKSIISHCCEKEGAEYTPSDFETVDISQKELDHLFLD